MADSIKEYIIKITADVDEAQKKLEGLGKALNKSNVVFNFGDGIEEQTKEITGAIGKLTEKFNDLQKSFHGEAISSDIKDMADTIKNSINEMKTSFDGFADTFKVFNGNPNAGGLGQSIKQFTDQMESMMAAYRTSMETIQNIADGSITQSSLQNAAKKTGKSISDSIEYTSSEIDKARKRLEDRAKYFADMRDEIFTSLTDAGKDTTDPERYVDYKSIISRLQDAIDEAEEINKKAGKIRIDIDEILGIDVADAQISKADLKNLRNRISEQINVLMENTEANLLKEAKKSKRDERAIKINLDVIVDETKLDDKAVSAMVSEIQNKLQSKVQAQMAKNPLKLPIAFSPAVENADTKTTDQIAKELTGTADEATNALIKEVQLKVTANLDGPDGLISVINRKIEELNNSGNLAKVEVDVIPKPIDETKYNEIADEVTDTIKFRNNSRGLDGVPISGDINFNTSGLATEKTLSAILGAISGIKDNGVSLNRGIKERQEDEKITKAATGDATSSVQDIVQAKKVKDYFRFMNYRPTKGQKLSKEYQNNLQTRQQIRTSLSAELQKREGVEAVARYIQDDKKTLDDFRKSDIYNKSYKYNGKEYALYGNDMELLSDFQKRIETAFVNGRKEIEAGIEIINEKYTTDALNGASKLATRKEKEELQEAFAELREAYAMKEDSENPHAKKSVIREAENRHRTLQEKMNEKQDVVEWQALLYEDNKRQLEKELKPAKLKQLITGKDGKLKPEFLAFKQAMETQKSLEATEAEIARLQNEVKQDPSLEGKLRDLINNRDAGNYIHSGVTEDEAAKAYVTQLRKHREDAILSATGITPEFQEWLDAIKEEEIKKLKKKVTDSTNYTQKENEGEIAKTVKEYRDASDKRIKSLSETMTGLGEETDLKTGQSKIDWKKIASKPEQGELEIRTALSDVRKRGKQEIENYQKNIDAIAGSEDDLRRYIQLGLKPEKDNTEISEMNSLQAKLNSELNGVLERGAYFLRFEEQIDSATKELNEIYTKSKNNGKLSKKDTSRMEELERVISGEMASTFEYSSDELVQAAQKAIDSSEISKEMIPKIRDRIKKEQGQLVHEYDFGYTDRYGMKWTDRANKGKDAQVANAKMFRRPDVLIPGSKQAYQMNKSKEIPELEKEIGELQRKMQVKDKDGGFDLSSLTSSESRKYLKNIRRLYALRMGVAAYEEINPEDVIQTDKKTIHGGIYKKFGFDEKISDIYANLPDIQQLESMSSEQLQTVLANLQQVLSAISEKEKINLSEEEIQATAIAKVSDDIVALEKHRDEIKPKLELEKLSGNKSAERRLQKDLDDTVSSITELKDNSGTYQQQIIDKARERIKQIDDEESRIRSDLGSDVDLLDNIKNFTQMSFGGIQDAVERIDTTDFSKLTESQISELSLQLTSAIQQSQSGSQIIDELTRILTDRYGDESKARETAENIISSSSRLNQLYQEREQEEDAIYYATEKMEKVGMDGGIASNRAKAYAEQIRQQQKDLSSARENITELIETIVGKDVVEKTSNSTRSGYSTDRKKHVDGLIDKARQREELQTEEERKAIEGQRETIDEIDKIANLSKKERTKAISKLYDDKIDELINSNNEIDQNLQNLNNERATEIEQINTQMKEAKEKLKEAKKSNPDIQFKSKTMAERLNEYTSGSGEYARMLETRQKLLERSVTDDGELDAINSVIDDTEKKIMIEIQRQLVKSIEEAQKEFIDSVKKGNKGLIEQSAKSFLQSVSDYEIATGESVRSIMNPSLNKILQDYENQDLSKLNEKQYSELMKTITSTIQMKPSIIADIQGEEGTAYAQSQLEISAKQRVVDLAQKEVDVLSESEKNSQKVYEDQTKKLSEQKELNKSTIDRLKAEKDVAIASDPSELKSILTDLLIPQSEKSKVRKTPEYKGIQAKHDSEQMAANIARYEQTPIAEWNITMGEAEAKKFRKNQQKQIEKEQKTWYERNAWRIAGMTEDQALITKKISELNYRKNGKNSRRTFSRQDQAELEMAYQTARKLGLEIEDKGYSRGYVKTRFKSEREWRKHQDEFEVPTVTEERARQLGVSTKGTEKTIATVNGMDTIIGILQGIYSVLSGKDFKTTQQDYNKSDDHINSNQDFLYSGPDETTPIEVALVRDETIPTYEQKPKINRAELSLSAATSKEDYASRIDKAISSGLHIARNENGQIFMMGASQVKEGYTDLTESLRGNINAINEFAEANYKATDSQENLNRSVIAGISVQEESEQKLEEKTDQHGDSAKTKNNKEKENQNLRNRTYTYNRKTQRYEPNYSMFQGHEEDVDRMLAEYGEAMVSKEEIRKRLFKYYSEINGIVADVKEETAKNIRVSSTKRPQSKKDVDITGLSDDDLQKEYNVAKLHSSAKSKVKQSTREYYNNYKKELEQERRNRISLSGITSEEEVRQRLRRGLDWGYRLGKDSDGNYKWALNNTILNKQGLEDVTNLYKGNIDAINQLAESYAKAATTASEFSKVQKQVTEESQKIADADSRQSPILSDGTPTTEQNVDALKEKIQDLNTQFLQSQDAMMKSSQGQRFNFYDEQLNILMKLLPLVEEYNSQVGAGASKNLGLDVKDILKNIDTLSGSKNASGVATSELGNFIRNVKAMYPNFDYSANIDLLEQLHSKTISASDAFKELVNRQKELRQPNETPVSTPTPPSPTPDISGAEKQAESNKEDQAAAEGAAQAEKERAAAGGEGDTSGADRQREANEKLIESANEAVTINNRESKQQQETPKQSVPQIEVMSPEQGAKIVSDYFDTFELVNGEANEGIYQFVELKQALSNYRKNNTVENAQDLIRQLNGQQTQFSNASESDFKVYKNSFTYRDAANPEGFKVSFNKDGTAQIQQIQQVQNEYTKLIKLQNQLRNLTGSDVHNGLFGLKDSMFQGSELEKIKEAREILEDLENLGDSGIFDENNNLLPNINTDDIQAKLRKVNEIYRQVTKDFGKRIEIGDLNISGIENAKQEMIAWAKANHDASVSIEGFSDNNHKMMYSIRTADDMIQRHVLSVDAMGKAYDSIVSETKYLSPLEKVMGGLGDKMQEIAKYTIASISIYDVINAVRQAVSTVKELDDALTEMRKVSDEPIEVLKAYQKESFNTADQLGTTAAQLQNSTANWMRLGESINEAKESARVSNLLLNVSEFSNIDDATQALVSVSQAYKDIDKMAIADKLNIIGNNFSVSTDQLAQGLQNAAAVLQTQGNDIDKSIALLTAGNAITQDMSKTSAGIRTIALRISGTEEAKNEIAEMGEDVDDFVVKTKSKTDQIIRDYTAVASNSYKGISVLDENGNLRDTYDILLDISKIYSEIQEEDKKVGANRAQALVETLAGKNRSNIAASILQNAEMLQDVYEMSKNDFVGSAMAENEKYLDSITGKMQLLQNQVQKFSATVVSSDLIKGIVDIGTAALKVVTGLVDKIGGVKTLLVGAGLIGTIKGLIKDVKNIAEDNSFLTNLRDLIKTNQLKDILSDNGITGIFAKISGHIKESGGLVKALITDIKGLGSAFIGLVSTHPVLLGIAAALTAIGVAYKLIDGSSGNAEKRMNDSIVNYNESKKNLEDINGELEQTKQRYNELLSRNGQLTFVEQAELEKLREATKELQTQHDLAQKKEIADAKQSAKDIENAYLEEVKNKYALPNQNGNLIYGEKYDAQVLISNMHILDKQISESKTIEEQEKYQNIRDALLESEYSEDNIWDYATKLQDYKNKLESLPKEAIGDEGETILNELEEEIEYIYKQFDPNKWKEMQYNAFISEEANHGMYQSVMQFARANEEAGISVGQLTGRFSDFVKAASGFDLTAEDLAKQISAEAIIANETAKAQENAEQVVRNLPKYDSFSDLLAQEDSESGSSFSTQVSQYENYMQKIIDIRQKIKDNELSTSDIKSVIEEFKDYPEIATAAMNGTNALDDALYKLGNDLTGTFTSANEATGIMGVFSDAMKSLSTVEARTQLQALIDMIQQLYNLDGQVGDLQFNKNLAAIGNNYSSTLSNLNTAYETAKNSDISDADWLSLVNSYPELASATEEINAQIKKRDSAIKETLELQKGGNVDLLNRPTISTQQLNKVGWDAGAGLGKATVFSSTYSNENGTVAMNFTPIMTDQNGKFLRALSPDGLQTYAEDVIAGVHDDYLNLKIGATFEGEDAINQAVNNAQAIHELQDQIYVDTEEMENATISKSQTMVNALNNLKFENLKQSIDDIRKSTEGITDPAKLQLAEDTIDHIINMTDFSDLNLDSARKTITDNLTEGITDVTKKNDVKQKLGAFIDGVFDSDVIAQNSSEAFQEINDIMSDAERWEILFKMSADSSNANASLDELYAKYQGIATEMKEFKFMDSPLLDEYNQAKSGGEAGDRYKEMVSVAKELEELANEGLVGTNQFKKGAALFSPNGMEDYENYQENLGKIQRYFTEDMSGVKNFLDDMGEKGLATFDEETQSWAYSIGDVQDAADSLGISFEMFTALIGRLSDYGFANDFFASVDEGTEHLTDLQGELREAENKLEQLKKEQENGDTTVTDTVISEQEARIEQIKESINNTWSLLNQLIGKTASDYETEAEVASDVITSLISEMGQTDNKSVHDRIAAQIEEMAGQYYIQLAYDEDGNIVGIVEESLETAQDTADNNPIKIKTEVEEKEKQEKRLTMHENRLTDGFDEAGYNKYKREQKIIKNKMLRDETRFDDNYNPYWRESKASPYVAYSPQSMDTENILSKEQIASQIQVERETEFANAVVESAHSFADTIVQAAPALVDGINTAIEQDKKDREHQEIVDFLKDYNKTTKEAREYEKNERRSEESGSYNLSENQLKSYSDQETDYETQRMNERHRREKEEERLLQEQEKKRKLQEQIAQREEQHQNGEDRETLTIPSGPEQLLDSNNYRQDVVKKNAADKIADKTVDFVSNVIDTATGTVKTYKEQQFKDDSQETTSFTASKEYQSTYQGEKTFSSSTDLIQYGSGDSNVPILSDLNKPISNFIGNVLNELWGNTEDETAKVAKESTSEQVPEIINTLSETTKSAIEQEQQQRQPAEQLNVGLPNETAVEKSKPMPVMYSPSSMGGAVNVKREESSTAATQSETITNEINTKVNVDYSEAEQEIEAFVEEEESEPIVKEEIIQSSGGETTQDGEFVIEGILDTSEIINDQEEVIDQIESTQPLITPELKLDGAQMSEQEVIDAIMSNPATLMIDGDASSARSEGESAANYVDTLSGTITENGNAYPARSEGDSAVGYINGLNGTISVDADTSKLDSSINTVLAKDHLITVRAQVTGLPSGGNVEVVQALGTAHNYGTVFGNSYRAFANGSNSDWTVGSNQEALVNEFAPNHPESIVRNGIWSIIPGGPHVEKLQKNDIIFNAQQTADLIRSGKTARAGKIALADGTAHNMMPAFAGKVAGGGTFKGGASSSANKNNGDTTYTNAAKEHTDATRKDTKTTKDNTDTTKDNTNAAKKSIEVFDWIEIKLNRAAEAVQKFADRITDFVSFTTNLSNLSKEINELRKQVSTATTAQKKYNDKADDILKNGYKYIGESENKNSKSGNTQKTYTGKITQAQAEAIQKGQFKIEEFTIKSEQDKANLEALKQYQTWWEKGAEAGRTAEEAQRQISEAAQQRLETIEAQYDAEIQVRQRSISRLQAGIDADEKRGRVAGTTMSEIDASRSARSVLSRAKERKSVEKQMLKLGKGGNVDLLNRPQIDTSELTKKGYKGVGKGKATVFSTTRSLSEAIGGEAGAKIAGTKKEKAINFTPILKDGTVLKPKVFEQEMDKILKGGKDEYGITLSATYEGKDAINAAVKDAENLHELQEKYYVDDLKSAKTVSEAKKNLRKVEAEDTARTFSKISGYINPFSKDADKRRKREESAYNSMITNEQDTIGRQEGKRNALQKELKDAVTNGDIKEGSSAYYDWLDRIAAVDEEIAKSKGNIAEWQESIAKLTIDDIGDSIDHLQTQAEKAQKKMDLQAARAGDGYIASAKSIDALDKNMSKQNQNVQKQNELLVEQRDKYDVGTDKWKEYNDQIEKNELTLLDNEKQQVEWRKEINNIPLEQAAKRTEKLSRALQILQNRLELATTSASKAAILNKQMANARKTLNTAENAASKAQSNQIKYANQYVKAMAKDTLSKGSYEIKDGTISATNKATAEDLKKIAKLDAQKSDMVSGKKISTKGLDEQSSAFKAADRANLNTDTIKESTKNAEDAFWEFISNISNYAEQLANLPLEDAQKKVDNLSREMNHLGKQLDLTTTAAGKQEIIQGQIENSIGTVKAYRTAARKTSSNLEKADASVVNLGTNGFNGLTDKQRNSINEAIASGEQIDISKYAENLTESEIEAIEKRNKALTASEEATNNAEDAEWDYVSSLVDYHTQLANLPIEEAEKKLNKLSDAMSILSKRLENATKSAQKRNILNQQIDNAQRQYEANQVAEEAARINLHDDKQKIKKTSTSFMKGLIKNGVITKDEAATIVQAVKDQETIDFTRFSGYSKMSDSQKNFFAQYNADRTAYDQARQNTKLSKEETRSQIRDISEQLANITIDERDKQLEKIDRKEELAQARYGNVESPKSRKEQLDIRAQNAEDTKRTYENAKLSAQNLVNETKSMVLSGLEDSGLTDKQKESITKKISRGLEVDTSNIDPNSDLFAFLEEYNAALKTNKTASHDAAMAVEDYDSTLQEITKLRFDNIVEWFEALKGIAEAKLQVDQSAQELLRAQGKSEYRQDMKSNLESQKQDIKESKLRSEQEKRDLIAEFGITPEDMKKFKDVDLSEYSKYGTFGNFDKEESMAFFDRAQAVQTILGIDAELNNLDTSMIGIQDTINRMDLADLQDQMKGLQESSKVFDENMNLVNGVMKDTQKSAASITDNMDMMAILGRDASNSMNTLKTSYEDLKANSEAQIQNLKDQNDDLQKLINNGKWEVGSEKYEEALAQIRANSDAIREAQKQQQEWNNAIAALPLDRLNIYLDTIQSLGALIKSQNDLTTAQGKDLQIQNYRNQIKNNEDQLDNMEEQLAIIQEHVDAARIAGYDAGKSFEQWTKESQDLKASINNTKADIEGILDTMRNDVFFRNLDRATEAAENFRSALSSIADLINEDMAFEDNGQLTDFGLVKASTAIKELESQNQSIELALARRAEIERQYNNGDNEGYSRLEYLDDLRDAEKELQDAINGTYQARQNIISLVETQARKELAAIQKVVDARKEALQKKKDYYDYDKTLKGKTKEIQLLEQQIRALEGVSDAESRAQKQRLESQLKEAQEDLDDTVLNHTIELQMEGLDKTMEALNENLDEYLKTLQRDLSEQHLVITNATDAVNNASDTIKQTIGGLLTDFNPKLTIENTGLTADSNKSTISVEGAYASGTKRVPKDGLYRLNEGRRQEIVTLPDGSVLMPLSEGSGVINANLTSKLMDIAKNYPAYPNLMTGVPAGANITSTTNVTFDSLITINGDVNESVLPQIENIAKELINNRNFKQNIAMFTSKQIAKDMRKGGL